MISRWMNGQRNSGGGRVVGGGSGLPATTEGVAAMRARAARVAGEGKGGSWLYRLACFGLAMIRESTEDVPRESCGHGVA